MKIYLSARFGRAAELRDYREELTAMGHQVIAAWLEEPSGNDGTTDPEALAEFAVQDLDDMRQCDCIVAFTEDPQSPWSRGGRHVEWGVMLERRNWRARLLGEFPQMWVVGPCENVFHALPFVNRCPTWEEFVGRFKTIR